MIIMALYSGLLGLILIYLSYAVVRQRRKLRIGLGDGENPDLSRVIRAHGNFIEHVPLALILLAVFESNSGHFIVAHIMGVLLVVGRLLHAYGLGRSSGPSIGRVMGTLFTWIVILALSCVNIYYFMSITVR